MYGDAYSAYTAGRDRTKGLRMPVGGFSGQGVEGSEQDLMDRERRRRERIGAFESYMGENPGAAPGGTGKTGLSPTDAKGWSDLLERRAQYAFDTGMADRTAFAGYSGGVLGGSDRGGRMQRGSAMRGLAGAAGVGFDDAEDAFREGGMEGKNRFLQAQNEGGGADVMGRLFSNRTVEGGVAEARRLGLMPQFDEQSEIDIERARGNAARRSMMTPMDRAAEMDDIAGRFEVPGAERSAMAQARGEDIIGQQRSHEFWRRGLPKMQQELELDERLARTRGEAAGYDDAIRAQGARDVANIRGAADRDVMTGRVSGENAQTALSTLQRIIDGYAARGDRANAQKYQQHYDALAGRLGVGMQQPGSLTQSTTRSSGPAVGTRAVINGQNAEWDGQGWVAVR
jgi:hypothetical protein